MSVVSGIPGLELFWLLHRAVPEWLNASFFAAALLGFGTQWSFSFVASRQSRQLNQRTGTALGEVKGLVEQMQRSLAELSSVSLTMERNLVELSRNGLVQAADGTGAGYGHDAEPADGWQSVTAGRPSQPVPREAPSDLPQRIRQVMRQRSGLPFRQVYDELVDETTLLSLLYALYRLRGDGVLAWEGAQLGWDTPLYLAPPEGLG